MIFFDTTKTGRGGQRSGLTRVSARLRDSLGDAAQEVIWNNGLRTLEGKLSTPRPEDTFLTSELFSEAERPGFTKWLASRPCRIAAIFHDAIPLQHPHITWPQSVARHPGYMKMLAGFDRVWAVSQASLRDLTGFWRWQGVEHRPNVAVLELGADFNAAPRVTQRASPAPRLLCVGILEPRKNQALVFDVCADLWNEGLAFELHVVGRVNPHFGAPILARLKAVRRVHHKSLRFHEAAGDATLANLYATSRASVFATIAEGCGLPLLESLWMGVPCVCSDLPVLRENADGGGCLPVAVNDHESWKNALRRILSDHSFHTQLADEAVSRPLHTWKDAAQTLITALRQS